MEGTQAPTGVSKAPARGALSKRASATKVRAITSAKVFQIPTPFNLATIETNARRRSEAERRLLLRAWEQELTVISGDTQRAIELERIDHKYHRLMDAAGRAQPTNA